MERGEGRGEAAGVYEEDGNMITRHEPALHRALHD